MPQEKWLILIEHVKGKGMRNSWYAVERPSFVADLRAIIWSSSSDALLGVPG